MGLQIPKLTLPIPEPCCSTGWKPYCVATDQTGLVVDFDIDAGGNVSNVQIRSQNASSGGRLLHPRSRLMVHRLGVPEQAMI